jgi:hypothetical protein
MSKSDATQASSNVNYQDDVNIGVNCEHDLDALATEDEVDNEAIVTEPADLVKAAVQKVIFVDKACYSFLIGILILASKNCLLSSVNSSASRESGLTNSNCKFSEWYIATKSYTYP